MGDKVCERTRSSSASYVHMLVRITHKTLWHIPYLKQPL